MALPLILLLATTALTLVTKKREADIQEVELERQAEEEKISAEGRELQRRQKLNKVLAANIVGQAASGIKGEGTPQSIALASAKQASTSEGIEALSDRLRQAQLKRRAANIKTGGKLAIASTLLKSGVQVAELG